MFDGTSSPTAASSLLSIDALHAALIERHTGAKSFPGRENYVGASEVGGCMRLTAWRKLHPESNTFAPDAAGRMRAGQVMENEAIQICRLALKGHVRETGANQAELELDGAPIRVHPDGRILASAIEHLSFSKVAVLLASGGRAYLDEVPTTDGALEIKTTSSHQLRRFRKDGLSLAYQDQTQVQMGAMGVSWGLLVMVSRENLADVEVFYLQADPAALNACRERALHVMSVVDKIRDGVLSEDGLPAPETERGYCSSCPILDVCPAMITERQRSGSLNCIPPDEIPDFEALVEERLALKPEADRYEEVCDLLKDRAVAIGFDQVTLPSGPTLVLSERQGREAADLKSLKSKFPEVAAQVVSRGNPYFVLSVKGARQ